MPLEISIWAAARLHNPGGWEHEYRTTPQAFAKDVLRLPFEMDLWALQTFPDHTLKQAEGALSREVAEARQAIDEYIEHCDSPFNLKRGGQSQTLRHEAAKELADVCIVAMRMVVALGFDPHQVILDKAAEVRQRTYDADGRRVR